jgi:hypothetical protein
MGIGGCIGRNENSGILGKFLLIFCRGDRLFGFELSTPQLFQAIDEGVTPYWSSGSLMFSALCHFRFLGING